MNSVFNPSPKNNPLLSANSSQSISRSRRTCFTQPKSDDPVQPATNQQIAGIPEYKAGSEPTANRQDAGTDPLAVRNTAFTTEPNPANSTSSIQLHDSRYNTPINQIIEKLHAAGFNYKRRTVRDYCARGIFDCRFQTPVDGGHPCWHSYPSAIDDLMEQLKRKQHSHGTQPATNRHIAGIPEDKAGSEPTANRQNTGTNPDAAQQAFDSPESLSHQELIDHIENLEGELLNARIEAEAKTQVLTRMSHHYKTQFAEMREYCDAQITQARTHYEKRSELFIKENARLEFKLKGLRSSDPTGEE